MLSGSKPVKPNSGPENTSSQKKDVDKNQCAYCNKFGHWKKECCKCIADEKGKSSSVGAGSESKN
jgi:hypothetical protein